MALTAVAMACSDGVKFPGSAANCNAYGFVTIGTDTRWRGPKFSIMYRFKLTNTLFTAGSALVGCAIANAQVAVRFALIATVGAVNIDLQRRINTTACGASLVTFHSFAKNAVEHSVAWTYNQAGTHELYFDGSLVTSGAAPCSDISGPALASDIFTVQGNTLFDGTDIFNVDRVFYSDDVMTATQISNAHSNCASF